MKITVWNEFRHEKTDEAVKKVYPNGIHNCIKDFLEANGFENVKTATLDEPENGLTKEVLDDTDVLFWWGHMAHGEVDDATVERVFKRVMEGMGMVFLHSAHDSKIFHKLMGTDSLNLRWRENNETEIMWNIMPGHPILQGVGANLIIPHEETYGEYFMIPQPDELLMISWFSGGEVFRSLCTFRRGFGRIVYFKPGHETFPIYHMPEVQNILCNAAKWAYVPNPAKIQFAHHPVPMMKAEEYTE